MEARIPFFYWPTKLMLVDDNLSFLETLSFKLKESLSPILNKDPHVALENLLAQKNKIASLVSLLTSTQYDNEQVFAKTLDYQLLVDLIYNKSRFLIISTALIDYKMPSLNGLKLCEKLENSPVKKIMLTGEATYQLVVSAFNKNIIDAFVLKDLNGIIETLDTIVLKMKKSYFVDLSLHLMGTFTEHDFKRQTEYLSIFQQFIEKNNIQEYYQIDCYGSYLGFDQSGGIHWLIVRSENYLNEMVEVLKHSGNVNSSISKPLKEKTHLLFLFSEAEKKLPTSNWHSFLFPILKSFQLNQNKYYCAMISNEFFDLNRERIFNFSRYKSEEHTYAAHV